MNALWCYKGDLVRSREHLCFSLTALDLLLIFFHFKNESTDLIHVFDTPVKANLSNTKLAHILQLREKKSELWDKKSQLPCFIFYSVAETGFHTFKIFFTQLIFFAYLIFPHKSIFFSHSNTFSLVKNHFFLFLNIFRSTNFFSLVKNNLLFNFHNQFFSLVILIFFFSSQIIFENCKGF